MSGVVQLTRLPIRIATGEVSRGSGAVLTGIAVAVAASAIAMLGVAATVGGDSAAVGGLVAVITVALVLLLDVTGAGFSVRRAHLSILRSLGWSRAQAAGPILIEHLLVGLGAGVVASTAAAMLLPRAIPGASPTLALWALPIATTLTVAAALPVAWAASAHVTSTRRSPRAPRVLPDLGIGVVVAVRSLSRAPLQALRSAALFGIAAGAIVLLVFGAHDQGGGPGGSSRAIAAGALLVLSGLSVAASVKRALDDRRDEGRLLLLLGWSASRVAWTLTAETALTALVGAAAGVLSGLAIVGTSAGAVTL